MARNIEIKAKARDFPRQVEIAREMSGEEPLLLKQKDVFYQCRDGRLKLRFENDDPPVLVGYHRPDQSGPKLSDYLLYKSQDGAQLDALLAKVLGRIGVVSKFRTVYLVGQTRVHLDEVEGLGSYLELEVVLRDEQSLEEGQEIANKLMNALGVEEEDLITGAYFDMLQEQRLD